MEIADELGVREYQNPGGGCLLTEKQYSLRLDDLIKYNQLEERYIKYLSIGRHFRISPQIKIVVGRKKQDNDQMLNLIGDEIQMRINNLQGPLGIINVCSKQDVSQLNAIEEVDLLLAASILLSFSNKSDEQGEVRFFFPDQTHKVVTVSKLNREKLREYWIT